MKLVRLAVPVRPQNPPETVSSTLAETQNGRRITNQVASHGAAKDMDVLKERPKRKAKSTPPHNATSKQKPKTAITGPTRTTTPSSATALSPFLRFPRKCIDSSLPVSNASKTCFASVSRIGTSGRFIGTSRSRFTTSLFPVFPPRNKTFVCLSGKSQGLVGHFSNLDIPKDLAFDCIRSEMRVKEETCFPQNQRWILRNLTTKQFVHSEAIALKPEFVHGPSNSVMGLGEVVTSCICWSTSSFTSMSDTANISRGIWAGHRLDITTLARHRNETHEVDRVI